MAPNTIAAEISGLILWHGAAQAVRVERSLLMFDAVRWARWIATQKREEEARVAGNGGIGSLAELNQQIREIDRWLITGRGTCPSTYILHRRQLFAPPMLFVTEDMSAAARHTGSYVKGRVVDRREMMRLVLDALRVSNRSLRLLI